MRYRLDVVAPTVLDAVQFAGGWIFDRVMAGWDVTVLIADNADVRPLEILGAVPRDLESVLESWAERPHPQTVAVSADLFSRDERVRRGVVGALDQGATEVTLWGSRFQRSWTAASTPSCIGSAPPPVPSRSRRWVPVGSPTEASRRSRRSAAA